jgi:hypothetical protein
MPVEVMASKRKGHGIQAKSRGILAKSCGIVAKVARPKTMAPDFRRMRISLEDWNDAYAM